MKKYTVLMYPPGSDLGEDPYWSQVKAASFRAAFKAAVKVYNEDAIAANVYDKEGAPGLGEFQCLAVVEGWGEMRIGGLL